MCFLSQAMYWVPPHATAWGKRGDTAQNLKGTSLSLLTVAVELQALGEKHFFSQGMISFLV